MKKVFVLLTVIFFTVFPTSAFDRNPKLVDLPENTWTILDSAGSIGMGGSNYFAYSGGAYDRTNHQFLVIGGGHWDGWKNDVIAFNIATCTWKSMYTPDPSSSYNCSNVNSTTPGMLLNTQMPASRHTWDMIDFIDHLGKMLIWSGATYSGIWSCPGNTLPADTWLYDYQTNQWEYKNVSRNPQPYDEGGAGAYDPIGKMYYCLSRRPSTLRLWRYNPYTDQWAALNTNGTVPWDGMMIADRTRQVLYCYPDYYDIKTNQWSTMTNTPSGLGGGSYGYVSSYDEVNDALVHVSNGKVFVYHIAQNRWETLSPSGTPSIDGSGTYGRFFYDPVDNVHLFIKTVDYYPRTWAYRYKGGAPTASETSHVKPHQPVMNVYPNPARAGSKIAVSCQLSAVSKVNLKVFNVNGKLVKTLKADGRQLKAGIGLNTSDLSTGLYLLKAKIGKKIICKKILVQK
jgi:hypothetical protein